MNRRNFLRMFCWLPFVKMPNLLNEADYGTDSILDDVGITSDTSPHITFDDLTGKWETYITYPSEAWELAPLTMFDKDVFADDADAWGSLREAWTIPSDDWINLEPTYFPNGDELHVHFPYGSINLGKMPLEATVSWWVEPQRPHTVSWFVEPWKPYTTSYCRHKGTLEVPADDKSHFIAICFEKSVAIKAYLDNNIVWRNEA